METVNDDVVAEMGRRGTAWTPTLCALLSVGGSVDPMDAFRAVVGRDADPTPLLRRRGLSQPGE